MLNVVRFSSLERGCAAALLVASSILAACGGGAGSPQVVQTATPPPPPPRAIAVTLAGTPSSLQIDTNQSESLSATVTNDRNNKGVTWKVTCPSGMTVCGTIAKASTGSGEADAYNAPADSFGAGSVSVQVTATSVSDSTKSASANVGVSAPPALVSPPPAAVAGNVGQYLYVGLCCNYVQGGAGMYAVSLKSGSLPSGLVFNPLDPNGGIPTLSGVPKAVSAPNLTFAYADSGNPSISLNFAVPITINPMLTLGALTPGPGALPDGTVGVPYVRFCRFICISHGAQLTVTGGTMPYTWSWAPVSASATPPGLVLDATCDAGAGLCNVAAIKGTPTAAASYNFIVTVTDSQSPPKHSSAAYSITINPSPSPSPSPSP